MSEFIFYTEHISDQSAIEQLYDKIFGPGRFTKSVSLLRENSAHNMELSHVVKIKQEAVSELIGSIRISEIKFGNIPALLLGPLIIDEKYHNMGLGKKLMQICLDKIANYKASGKIAAKLIFLVGDLDYYKKFNFTPLLNNKIVFPAAIEKSRLLILELEPNIASKLEGRVKAVNKIYAS